MPAPSDASSLHELPVVPPYRLDLTVSALRRLPSNLVDVYTADGHYLRAFEGAAGPAVVRVAPLGSETLMAAVSGGTPRDREEALQAIPRMLGTHRDVTDFSEQARRLPWLAPLARRMRGLRPPRYPTLWEACVNAIVFQQISLAAASAIMRRLILDLGHPTECGGIPLAIFPSAERFLESDDGDLRAAGLSAGKIATLRRVGSAITAGTLSEAELEERTSAEAALLLRRINGIGPWTAAVILLRGLGRLDAFPGNDTGVATNLELVAGERLDAGRIAEMLGPQRGMLYFCLLLARLEARGEIGQVSDVAR
jgi:DNA-3-methyladenine glycosylase II